MVKKWCVYCGREGHHSHECPRLKEQQKVK